MDFRILGALEVVSAEGQRVRLGGSKQRALLGILLLNANILVSRDRLIDLLWGEDPPESAVGALQVHVHGLRKILEPERLKTQGSGYSLRVAPGELDLESFIDLCDEGKGRLGEGDALGARDSFDSALALWRGAPFADLGSEPFAETEAGRLEELRLAAAEDRVDAELLLGRHRELIPELTTLVESNPYRERLHARLMLALFRAGRQAEALDAYQRARAVLAEELGLDPSEELRDLQAAILRRDPSLLVESHELRARRHLPAPATELIGRRSELDEILALLGDSSVRILTLIGPGGTGKTRLALRAAHESAQAFADGVFFVDLSPLRDPRQFASTLARSLGLDERVDQQLTETLQEHLRERELLLVLDNFEHVEEAAPMVSALLVTAPGVKALVTSRSPLRLYGEHLYAVPGMAEEESVALYLARARAAGYPDRGGEGSERSVARICVALDYLPLAIELAAARSRELSLPAMEQLLSRRLELAVAGPRDAPTRQQTLRTAIGWSYELLDEVGGRVLRKAAVFAGSFSAEAAAAVCGARHEDLRRLVDGSLLRRLGITDEPRFAMLETIREFALEQLQSSGELKEARAAHAAHYAGLAEQGDRASAT
ncbi:MAG: AAA family ATPase, partial [Actinomycetota bacterium]|nr:AAA family ATPase [Actinomycetota bacterium]